MLICAEVGFKKILNGITSGNFKKLKVGRYQTWRSWKIKRSWGYDPLVICLYNENNPNKTHVRSLTLNKMVIQQSLLGDKMLPWVTESVSTLEDIKQLVNEKGLGKAVTSICYIKIRLLFLIVLASMFSCLLHMFVLK